jgi:hypothetical protein
MVPNEKLKQIRKKYESLVFELFDDLDESGFNSETYKTSFSKMNDKEFIDMAKQLLIKDDFVFSIDTNQLESEKEGKITLDKIKRVADKHKIKLVEYVFMPFRNTKKEPMCTLTRVPILYCQVRRFFQQMLQHKNSISNDNSKINPLTGQVVQSDKTASTTNIQTYALTITNREAALKEYLGPRADDNVAKQEMLTQIEQTGRFSLDNTTMQTHNRQSVNTAETFAKAAGVVVEFSGNDYKIDMDNL